MVNCPDPKCNAPNPDSAKFCKKCGALIGKSGENKTCSKGHVLDPSWGGRCPQCESAARAVQPDGIRPPTLLEDPPDAPPPLPPPSQQPRRKTKVEGGPGPVPTPGPDMKKLGGSKRKTVVAPMHGGEVRPEPSALNRLVGFLVTYSDDPSGHFFDIREGRYVIGSGDRSDIHIPNDGMMSSEHAILLYRRGKFLFRDNLSTNGSFINEEEVIGDTELANYDAILLGNTEFRLIMVEP